MVIYSNSQEVLTSLINGAVVTFSITESESFPTGEIAHYSIDESIRTGGYSPLGNWMPYFVLIMSNDDLGIPSDGELFTLSVSIDSEQNHYAFTEHCCSPRANSISAPASMVTGKVYTFQASNALLAGGSYRTESSITWRPVIEGVYTTQVSESGYVNPQTKTDMATSNFNSVMFAVPNIDKLPAYEATGASNAVVNIRTYFMSSDFADGIIITDLTAAVPLSPREEVDEELKPVLTTSLVDIAGSPELSIVNGKFTHRQTTVACTPNAQFQFGDSLSYIHISDGTNRFSGSISFPAVGIAPGTEYVRPDTGEQDTATDESICGITISVVGNKWGLSSDEVTATYTVLYYYMPRFTEFSVHRASVSTAATDYQYNGTHYKKDDFGAYCLILYKVDYCDLQGYNDYSAMLQYGTHRQAITPELGTLECIVVPANTEQTLDVIITQYDIYYPYGVSAKLRLSTANVLIDFLAGGKGMAIGKTATVENALDISPTYRLLFYNATVGAYQGTSQRDLVAWMHDTEAKIAALEGG